MMKSIIFILVYFYFGVEAETPKHAVEVYLNENLVDYRSNLDYNLVIYEVCNVSEFTVKVIRNMPYSIEIKEKTY